LLDLAAQKSDRSRADEKILVYTSAALDADIEITGHPVITLQVASTHEDGALFAYLEMVNAKGQASLITDGYMRLVHRLLSKEKPLYEFPVPYHSFKRKDVAPMLVGEIETVVFDLFPTSVLVPKGQRLRLAIAGADDQNFSRYPSEGNPVITVHRSKMHPSFIQLPVIPR
jgi:putative CocE/NonD family hydrolase